MSNPAMKGGGVRGTRILDIEQEAERELTAGLGFDLSLFFISWS